MVSRDGVYSVPILATPGSVDDKLSNSALDDAPVSVEPDVEVLLGDHVLDSQRDDEKLLDTVRPRCAVFQRLFDLPGDVVIEGDAEFLNHSCTMHNAATSHYRNQTIMPTLTITPTDHELDELKAKFNTETSTVAVYQAIRLAQELENPDEIVTDDRAEVVNG